MKTWKDKDLKGQWEVSLKIDGVCVIVKPNGDIISRKNKPLYNMGHLKLKPGVYEVFLGSWEETVSAVRSSKQARVVNKNHLYPLDPVDSRLREGVMFNPTAAQIRAKMKAALKRGYEGLVLRQDDYFLKVKDKTTYDVTVLEVIPGKGKHAGKMGALMTPLGKVGTGFSDKERAYKSWKGKTIEIESMGLTPGGKCRHARFLRLRFDK